VSYRPADFEEGEAGEGSQQNSQREELINASYFNVFFSPVRLKTNNIFTSLRK